MQVDEKHTLWRLSAALIGVAMPTILVGRAVFAIVLLLGILAGLMATKGESLRSSARMMKNSRFLSVGIAFIIAMFASAAFSLDRMSTFSTSFAMLGVGFCGLLLFLVLREMPGRHVHFSMQALCVSLMVTMILAVADAYLGDARLAHALHGEKAGDVHRLNYMSNVLAVLIPFMWAWLLQRYREQAVLARWFALPLCVFSFAAVFICGGRSGWLAVFVAAILFLYISGKRKDVILHGRHWLLATLVLVFGPLAYALARGKMFVMERLGLSGEEKEMLISLDLDLINVWVVAFKNMLTNPITGIGAGMFRKLPEAAEKLPNIPHPHNAFIQTMLETGILGFVPLCVLLYLAFKKFNMMGKNNLFGLAGFCALVSFTVSSSVSMSIFQPWWVSFLLFSLILAARIGWVERPKHDK